MFADTWQPDDIIAFAFEVVTDAKAGGTGLILRVGRLPVDGPAWDWSEPKSATFSAEVAARGAVLRPAVLLQAYCGARFFFGGPHDPLPAGLTDQQKMASGATFGPFRPFAESFAE